MHFIPSSTVRVVTIPTEILLNIKVVLENQSLSNIHSGVFIIRSAHNWYNHDIKSVDILKMLFGRLWNQSIMLLMELARVVIGCGIRCETADVC